MVSKEKKGKNINLDSFQNKNVSNRPTKQKRPALYYVE